MRCDKRERCRDAVAVVGQGGRIGMKGYRRPQVNEASLKVETVELILWKFLILSLNVTCI